MLLLGCCDSPDFISFSHMQHPKFSTPANYGPQTCGPRFYSTPTPATVMQQWSLLTDPYRSAASKPVKCNGRTDGIHRCCYEYDYRSQYHTSVHVIPANPPQFS